MDIVAGSKNDEFYTPLYAIKPIEKYITPPGQIWCPFDTEDSSYNLDVISNFLKKEFGMNIKIPKQGQWLKYDFVPSKNWICSECDGLATMGYESFAGYYNYCPNCGAKMEVKE